MKIKQVKKLGGSKYRIVFDNGTIFNTFDEIILENKLLYKTSIDSNILVKLENDTKKYQVYDKTIRFISRRIRSKKEVRDYLLKNNVENIDEIIHKLKSNNLIDDKKFMQAYVQDRISLSNDGPIKIKRDLLDNNIDEHLIDKEIYRIDYNYIYSKLEKLILKKVSLNRNKSIYILKQKILLDMSILGYEKSMIELIINKNVKQDKSIVKKEYDKLKRKLSKKYESTDLEFRIVYALKQKGFNDDDIDSIK